MLEDARVAKHDHGDALPVLDYDDKKFDSNDTDEPRLTLDTPSGLLPPSGAATLGFAR